MSHTPDLRRHAFDEFGLAWEKAIAAGVELHAALDHLRTALADMAANGSRQTLQFDNELVQAWWVVYQEAHGAMIPREPLEAPIGAHA